MSIFGSKSSNLFGVTRTIIQTPTFLKKRRKKACDFIHTVSDSELKKGDVIGVHRIGGVYDHYGIYTGRGKVIHFSNEGSDFGGDIRVRRATLSQFKNGADNVFVVDFEAYRDYVENPSLWDSLEEGKGILEIKLRKKLKKWFGNELTLYSPKETVERAESQLGREGYNIVFNNCEHFALWCKTGVEESTQVQNFFEAIGDISPMS